MTLAPLASPTSPAVAEALEVPCVWVVASHRELGNPCYGRIMEAFIAACWARQG